MKVNGIELEGIEVEGEVQPKEKGNVEDSGWGCCEGLSDKATVLFIKKLCEERIEKYGLHSVKSGACKSCPYRYRGDKVNRLCCSFATIPMDWSNQSINEKYGDI